MRAQLLTIALALCGAAKARAECEVEIVGDADVAAQVRDALVAFGDDGAACVAVRAACNRDAGEIALDISDPLGRSVHRRFHTADGAAAFLISWSRRPLPQAGTPIERLAVPVATPASPVAVAATAAPTAPPPAPAPDSGLRSELHVAYLGAPFASHWAALVQGALVRQHGMWRYGGDVRVVGAEVSQMYFSDGTQPLMWLGIDAEATFGLTWKLGHLTMRAELAAGLAYVSVLSYSASVHFQTAGLRGGARGAIAAPLFSTVSLETGFGWDVLRQTGELGGADAGNLLGRRRYLDQLHLEIGLLWVL